MDLARWFILLKVELAQVSFYNLNTITNLYLKESKGFRKENRSEIRNLGCKTKTSNNLSLIQIPNESISSKNIIMCLFDLERESQLRINSYLRNVSWRDNKRESLVELTWLRKFLLYLELCQSHDRGNFYLKLLLRNFCSFFLKAPWPFLFFFVARLAKKRLLSIF